MVKHKKRGRGRFQTWPVEGAITLSTLASGIVIAADLIDLAQAAYFISADLTWTMEDAQLNEGPIRVGLNHQDLSVLEIKEATEAVPAAQDDIVQIERSRRPVRDVGAFTGQSSVDLSELTLNNGMPIRTRIKFRVGETQELGIWAKNIGLDPLSTGAVVRATGLVYGNWLG